MKVILILLAITFVIAQGEGESCTSNDQCSPFGLYCATWEDVEFGQLQSCEDCTPGADTFVYDSFGNRAPYECPPGAPLVI